MLCRSINPLPGVSTCRQRKPRISKSNSTSRSPSTAQLALNPSHRILAGLITEADAKGPRIGGATVSADGRTLFALGTSIVAIDTASLKIRTRILEGESVDSIRLSSDGKWLYAAGSGSSKVWQINPATGAVSGEVPGTTNPWVLLWAAPK
jgi:DNA-binding beta-propeller fold protein YncE